MKTGPAGAFIRKQASVVTTVRRPCPAPETALHTRGDAGQGAIGLRLKLAQSQPDPTQGRTIGKMVLIFVLCRHATRWTSVPIVWVFHQRRADMCHHKVKDILGRHAAPATPFQELPLVLLAGEFEQLCLALLKLFKRVGSSVTEREVDKNYGPNARSGALFFPCRKSRYGKLCRTRELDIGIRNQRPQLRTGASHDRRRQGPAPVHGQRAHGPKTQRLECWRWRRRQWRMYFTSRRSSHQPQISWSLGWYWNKARRSRSDSEVSNSRSSSLHARRGSDGRGARLTPVTRNLTRPESWIDSASKVRLVPAKRIGEEFWFRGTTTLFVRPFFARSTTTAPFFLSTRIPIPILSSVRSRGLLLRTFMYKPPSLQLRRSQPQAISESFTNCYGRKGKATPPVWGNQGRHTATTGTRVRPRATDAGRINQDLPGSRRRCGSNRLRPRGVPAAWAGDWSGPPSGALRLFSS